MLNKKRADFLLLQITLVNDSREEDRRKEEIFATLKDMLNQVPTASKIELFTEEFTLNKSHYQIPLVDLQDKRDTSRTSLYAKVPLVENDDVGKLAEVLRSYVSHAKGVGRTEIFTGNLGVSIIQPEKYRYEVLQAVAADVKRIKETFGDAFEVIVTGLDSRLIFQRSSISEVELYLPIGYEVFPLKGSKIMMRKE